MRSKDTQIDDLIHRSTEAKDFLTSLLALNPVSNNTYSTTWHHANNTLRILYLDVFLHWLNHGYTTCQATLERVPGYPSYIEDEEIEAVLQRVELVVAAYKATHIECDDEELLVLPSETSRKRARSPADSGVGVDSQRSKRSRLSTVDIDSDSDSDVAPRSSTVKRSPQFATSRNKRVIEDDSSDDDDDEENVFTTQEVDEDSDEAYTPADEPTAFRTPSSLKRSNRPANINTAHAEQYAGYATELSPRTKTPTPAPMPKTKTPTPKTKTPKPAAPNPQAKHPWEAGWIPIRYNGHRGRPEGMPHVPCPEGQNPRVWYGLSYAAQLLREEELRMLEEMGSEDKGGYESESESEWED